MGCLSNNPLIACQAPLLILFRSALSWASNVTHLLLSTGVGSRNKSKPDLISRKCSGTPSAKIN